MSLYSIFVLKSQARLLVDSQVFESFRLVSCVVRSLFSGFMLQLGSYRVR